MKPARQPPSLHQLRVLEAVARHKSIGRAAPSLGLSQPAVTQEIASLETRIGVTLLERRYTGSYLTDFGTILLARTERLFDLIRRALEDLFGASPPGEKIDIAALVGKITATHIRSLVAVSENPSFEQAARSIGVSQPSLHRAARDFERHLRRSIYFRGPRGTSTTGQGGELARKLKLAMRELDYAFDEIRSHQGLVTARISVGTCEAAGDRGAI
jgi:LysR family transcriptional regulator of gallate degradation